MLTPCALNRRKAPSIMKGRLATPIATPAVKKDATPTAPRLTHFSCRSAPRRRMSVALNWDAMIIPEAQTPNIAP